MGNLKELLKDSNKNDQNLFKDLMLKNRMSEVITKSIEPNEGSMSRSDKRKILKQQDIQRRQAKAQPKLPSGDVTKGWTRQRVQVKTITPKSVEPFTLKKVDNGY